MKKKRQVTKVGAKKASPKKRTTPSIASKREKPAVGLIKKRDLEVVYSRTQMAKKLRRFADSLISGKPFRIQIAGERVLIPAAAAYSIEHERSTSEEEIEFQLKWKV